MIGAPWHDRRQRITRLARTAARHDEKNSESGRIFAAALVIVLAIIFIIPALIA